MHLKSKLVCSILEEARAQEELSGTSWRQLNIDGYERAEIDLYLYVLCREQLLVPVMPCSLNISVEGLTWQGLNFLRNMKNMVCRQQDEAEDMTMSLEVLRSLAIASPVAAS